MDTASLSQSPSHSVTPAELALRLGRPDAPLLLDVRRDGAFLASAHRLAAALRCAPEAVDAWAAAGPAREVVTYCVHGHQVSRQAAATLGAAGWNARYLAGGILGGEDGVDPPAAIVQWRTAGLLRVRQRADLGVTGQAPSKWITRRRPKIDRIACPWLILRFIDPRAQFFYASPETLHVRASDAQAIAFDVEGAAFGHRGERCSFDALLEDFELRDPALDRLATIVRGADTGRPTLAPECAGLLATTLGLAQLHQDDHAMLAAALPLYDALYAHCRLAVDQTRGGKAGAA